MKTFNLIGCVKTHYEKLKERNEEARRKKIIKSAEERIQVREYMSELHICIDGVPIAKADDFRKPFNEVLSDMRTLFAMVHY